jgi:hypothetical protein
MGSVCDVEVITIQLTIAGGASILTNFPASELTGCGYAAQYFNFDYESEDLTVCQLDLGNVVMAHYEYINTALVVITYSDNSESAPSYLCGWNNGLYYNGDCTTSSTATVSNDYPNFIEDITTLYKIPSAAAIPIELTSSMSIGVLEWTNGDEFNVFVSNDVVQYMQVNNISYNVTSQLNMDYYFAGCTQDETTLDVDLVSGLVPGATTYLYSVYVGGTVSALGGWLKMLEQVLESPTELPPTVWSVSWTFGDPLYNPSVVESITARFRLLSLAGITVVAASGDSGASFDGEEGMPLVAFPDASPYCLSVGATSVSELASGFGGVKEKVCSANDGNIITSGGGFSSMYLIPPFQSEFSAVDGQSMRGAPDIAALGANIAIYVNSAQQLLFGTSAATPIVASVLTLLNAQRKHAGMSALPLVHYFLYNTSINGGFFTDVTQGDNCATEGNDPTLNFGWYAQGSCYSAGSGWDAVTGLGTPNYPAMLTGALNWNPLLNAPSAGYVIPNPPSSHTSDNWFPGLSLGGGYAVAFVIVIFVSACCSIGFRMYRRNQRRVTVGIPVTQHQQAAFLASTPSNGVAINQQHPQSYNATYQQQTYTQAAYTSAPDTV